MKRHIYFLIIVFISEPAFSIDCSTDCEAYSKVCILKNFQGQCIKYTYNYVKQGICNSFRAASCGDQAIDKAREALVASYNKEASRLNGAIKQHLDFVTFDKHGNNGTVSCDAFCAGSDWGKQGLCVAAFDTKSGNGVSCGYTTGYLGGPELTCTCLEIGLKLKHGNNGTVNCDKFCSNANWSGWSASCAVAQNTKDNQWIDCFQAPGFLSGPELTCYCDTLSVPIGW